MTQALVAAIEQVEQLPDEDQDALAAILVEEIASEHRWSKSFARSESLIEKLASEATAEFEAGRTRPLDDSL